MKSPNPCLTCSTLDRIEDFFNDRGQRPIELKERMRYAFEHRCDQAMMVAVPGSESQRNAERRGFQIAYTRTKWQLSK